ncbi:MAG: hypothetical protein LQ337_003478 [Flavoplaca oasis]|nr:MAG: hypothetical protein LQ337_003478 [Flavoplaca oasis]
MAAANTSLQLALVIRDLIVDGSFDQETFNQCLQPHAKLVLRRELVPLAQESRPLDQNQQPLPSNQPFRPSYHPLGVLTPDASASAHRNSSRPPVNSSRQIIDLSCHGDSQLLANPEPLYGPASPTLEWPVPIKKMRRPLPSIDPDEEEIDEASRGSSDLTASPNGPTPSGQQPDQAVYDLRKSASWKQFLTRWHALAHRRTNDPDAIKVMFKYDNLPPNTYTFPQRPYFELDLVMDFVEGFGNFEVQQTLVAEFRTIFHSVHLVLPSLSTPSELEDFQPSMRAQVIQLWRAARLRDFWEKFKKKSLVMWRTAVYKELRLFHETVEAGLSASLFPLPTSADPSMIRSVLYKMYDDFSSHTSKASQLKHKLTGQHPYSHLYSAFTKQFDNDGIVAMMTRENVMRLHCNNTRCDAIIDALRLLKPEFYKTRQLEVYSSYIDKVYEGNQLTEADLAFLENYAHSDRSAMLEGDDSPQRSTTAKSGPSAAASHSPQSHTPQSSPRTVCGSSGKRPAHFGETSVRGGKRHRHSSPVPDESSPILASPPLASPPLLSPPPVFPLPTSPQPIGQSTSTLPVHRPLLGSQQPRENISEPESLHPPPNGLFISDRPVVSNYDRKTRRFIEKDAPPQGVELQRPQSPEFRVQSPRVKDEYSEGEISE